MQLVNLCLVICICFIICIVFNMLAAYWPLLFLINEIKLQFYMYTVNDKKHAT